jgi:hypothetical protein
MAHRWWWWWSCCCCCCWVGRTCCSHTSFYIYCLDVTPPKQYRYSILWSRGGDERTTVPVCCRIMYLQRHVKNPKDTVSIQKHYRYYMLFACLYTRFIFVLNHSANIINPLVPFFSHDYLLIYFDILKNNTYKDRSRTMTDGTTQ